MTVITNIKTDMMEIKINGRIEIDLSDRFAAALEGFGAQRSPALHETSSARTEQAAAAPPAEGEAVAAQTEKDQVAAAAAVAPPAEEPVREPGDLEPEYPMEISNPTHPADLPPFWSIYRGGEITDAMMRTAMDEVMTRLCGEGWQTGKSVRARLRPAAGDEFKRIAAILGAAKPTALPQEKRENFFALIDRLTPNDEGTGIKQIEPF